MQHSRCQAGLVFIFCKHVSQGVCFIGIIHPVGICACNYLFWTSAKCFRGLTSLEWSLTKHSSGFIFLSPCIAPVLKTASRSSVNLCLVFMVALFSGVDGMRSGYSPHPAYQLLTIFLFPQAQVRLKGAGLGAKGSAYGLSGADSYKDAVRKAMFARFTEME